VRARSEHGVIGEPRRHLAGDHEQLVEYLESDQLVEERARPLGPARLSDPAAAGLWVLRVFAIVMAAMVIYTFAAHL
jgi:hypothetical protein